MGTTMPQHTKDKLADALALAGLTAMAAKAREGYYHDFLSPLDLPEMQLLSDLAGAHRDCTDQQRRDQISDIRKRAMDGDFDASIEESDAWAESAEGQATLRALMDK